MAQSEISNNTMLFHLPPIMIKHSQILINKGAITTPWIRLVRVVDHV